MRNKIAFELNILHFQRDVELTAGMVKDPLFPVVAVGAIAVGISRRACSHFFNLLF